MSGKGIDQISLRIPTEWNSAWFARFCRDVLAKGDTRNQIEGPGIVIDGTSDTETTISASEDLQNLLLQEFVLASASGFLEHERILAGESGVISITDGGDNGDITVGINTGGINLSKIQELLPLSVVGNPINTDYAAVQIQGAAQYDVLHIDLVSGDETVLFSAIDHNYISDFNEAAQDAVGTILVDSNSIDFTYSDSTPSITADVKVAYDFPWTGVHTWTRSEPRLIFNESDVGTNLKVWDIDINASVWKIRSRTDADGTGADFLSLVRGTTTTFASMYVGSTGLTLGTNDANLLYANGGAATLDMHAQDTQGRVRLRRYNGSMTGSPTEILNNQVLGQHIFQAYSSTAAAIRSPVVFQATATENWASGATGTKWTVTTTANGASSASLSLTLQGDQFQTEDGLVTAPAQTFRNDLDSGRYRIGANNIGDAVNGAKVLDISTTGLGVTGTMVASGAISGSNLSASGGANPSASVGLSAVNGSAITFMRSDGAPALSQTIAPTWTGQHIFTAGIDAGKARNSSYSDVDLYPFVTTKNADARVEIAVINESTASNSRGGIVVGVIGASEGGCAMRACSSNYGSLITGSPTGASAAVHTGGNIPLVLGTNDTARLIFLGDGSNTTLTTPLTAAAITATNITATPASGVALTANGIANQNTVNLNASTTSGQSYGLRIAAGTNSSDGGLFVNNAANNTQFFAVFGNGQSQFSDGSASVPGQSWGSDTNTGRYRIGADNMGDAVGGNLIVDYAAARVSFQIPVRLKGYTVATLPAGTVGDAAYVTDALVPAFLVAVVGGGAVKTPVFYDGTNWVAG